ncbi:MAG: alpha/beta hydrolase-fold protein, partial [Bacteroidota bacterium]|nr:alpha/beta hydrolase-fold protein [Bacteroidota bacterium]
MLTKKNMCHFLLAILSTLSVLVSSCDKNADLPDNPNGTFVRYAKDIALPSKVLGMNVNYSIYLPGDYVKNKTKRYGVVYLLHGYGDNNNSWNDQYLRITSLIDSLEATGTVSPMIYVLPQGFNSYYVNKYDGSFDYMKMFVNELVPYIDKTYRTIADRDHRAVVGYSMGGFGAMVIPSMNPSVFSVSVPLSMSFRTDAQYTTEPADGWNKQWGSIFGGYGLLGEARLTAYYKSLCPLHFFTKASASSFSRMHYFLDCGDDEEQLSVGN